MAYATNATQPHGTYHLARGEDGACKSVCSCGWESVETMSAGMAGSHWDEHQAQPPIAP